METDNVVRILGIELDLGICNMEYWNFIILTPYKFTCYEGFSSLVTLSLVAEDLLLLVGVSRMSGLHQLGILQIGYFSHEFNTLLYVLSLHGTHGYNFPAVFGLNVVTKNFVVSSVVS